MTGHKMDVVAAMILAKRKKVALCRDVAGYRRKSRMKNDVVELEALQKLTSPRLEAALA